ncbi:MAG: LPS-assembly protein LptD [Deltaproteobacteria bacterium]|nr:LPS-assembly protein LptD [Deltaproteobacteria bacterium]
MINKYCQNLCPIVILVMTLLVIKGTCAVAQPTLPPAHLTLQYADGTWDLHADQIDIRESGNLLNAKGNVSIKTLGVTIFAQEALLDRGKGLAEVTGNIRFESNGDILTGEKGTFDLHNRTGKILNGQLFLKENHYYIESDVMEKVGDNTYYVKNGRLTTCDGDTPDWSITCSEIKVTIEGYGTIKHAAFRVRDIPVFYFPYMFFPAKLKRQSGLLPPAFGYSDRNGMDIEIPFFWAISNRTDATFYERYMTERGLMQGVEFRYMALHDSKGTFLYDVLDDKKNKDMTDPEDLDISPLPRTNRTRYWFRGKVDQQLSDGLTARLDMDLISDQDYLRELDRELYGFGSRPDIQSQFGRPVNDTHSLFRQSAWRLDYQQQGYGVQAQGSYYQKPENTPRDETPQPLAGLDYTLLPRPVPGLPFFFALDTDYDHIWRDYGQKGHRSSLTPRLAYPMWWGRYLEFEPSFSYTQVVQWFDDDPNMDQQTKDAYDIQTRFSTSLERIFNFDGKEIKRLRHKIVPSLNYQYRVPGDDQKTQPWFEPIDVDGKINRATFSIDNFLDARKENNKKEITYSRWGDFSLSQGYDLDEAHRDRSSGTTKEPFDPLVGSLTLRPSSFAYFSANAYWDHYQKHFNDTDVSLDLSIPRSAGRQDTLTVDYAYHKEGDRNLNYSFGLNLLHGLSIGASVKRDLVKDENISQVYWTEYTSQCWGIRLTVEEDDRDTSYMLTIRLLGLGDISSR